MSNRNKVLVYIVFVASLILIDQLTKFAIRVHFSLHESVPVINGLFSITYIRNPGAAFGFLANAGEMIRRPFLLIMPIGICLVLLLLIRQIWNKNKLLEIAYCLVMAGAIGNLIDRFYFGYVVDFLDFYYNNHHFPAFNVADSSITIAAGLLIIDFIREAIAKKRLQQSR